jgi:hypothetical protein
MTEEQIQYYWPRIVMFKERRSLAMTMLSQCERPMDARYFAALRTIVFTLGIGVCSIVVAPPHSLGQWIGLLASALICFFYSYMGQSHVVSRFSGEYRNYEHQKVSSFVDYFVDKELHGESKFDEDLENKILTR